MESFYVTLSSNACTEYYPENTVGRFWNLLASPLELKELGDGRAWEVGLSDICVPGFKSPIELRKEDYTFTFWTPSVYHPDQEPNPAEIQTEEVSHFWTLEGFSKAMSAFFRSKKLKGSAGNCKAEAFVRIGLIRLKTPKNVFVKFSPKMMQVLGLNQNDMNKQGFFGSRKRKETTWGRFDPWVGARSLWVYSDCCEHRAVGGSRVPLLRNVCPSKYHVGDLVQRYYENPMYIPVRRHYICLLYTSPSPRDLSTSRMPSSA